MMVRVLLLNAAKSLPATDGRRLEIKAFSRVVPVEDMPYWLTARGGYRINPTVFLDV